METTKKQGIEEICNAYLIVYSQQMYLRLYLGLIWAQHLDIAPYTMLPSPRIEIISKT